MHRLPHRLQRCLVDDDGTTAVEYSVMLAMILLVVIVGISAFGASQDSYWGRINTQMQSHGIGP